MKNKSLKKVCKEIDFQYSILRNLKHFYDPRINIGMIRDYLFKDFEKNMWHINRKQPGFVFHNVLDYVRIISYNFIGMLWPKSFDSFEYKQSFYNRWNEKIIKEQNDIQ